MRRPVIAGNWKLFKTQDATRRFLKTLVGNVSDVDHSDIVVAPPFTSLAAAVDAARGSNVAIAAQDVYWETEGAFTGEVSAPMLADVGCGYSIIGHSERRQYFGETDTFVAEKVKAAMAAGLRPIACIGETLAEREAKKTLEVVFRQLDAIVFALETEPGLGVIAYEPVWAIGTGKVATAEQAQEVHAAIRERLKGVSATLSNETAILYGGSVKADNAASLLGCRDIDGALVGGASLDADGFAKIALAIPA
jgi:triosephosphate isomerase